MIDKKWIERVNDVLSKDSIAFDFLYIINTIYNEKKFGLIDVLKNAENGYGMTVHEGLLFSLENDFDNPDEFKGAVFFVGDYESSKMKISKFIELLDFVTKEYFNDTGNELVLNKLKNIRSRYGR